MSDFDTVLERLLTDPLFQARLTADPQAALADYRLDPHERELLGAQLVQGGAVDHTLEMRTSKSGIVGMLGPIVSALGIAASDGAGGNPGPLQTLGSAGDAPAQTLGSAGGPEQTLGSAGTATQTLGTAGGATQSLGSAGGATQTPGGIATGVAGGVSAVTGAGAGPGVAPAPPLTAPEPPAHVPAAHYHTHVDADGDGRWDPYRAYERSDGGVDIEVDMDHDGRVDFVGHDLNRDGLVEDAVFDNDHDGAFETQMYDDNGDGWMDRSEHIPPHAG